jgi:hypothetical protein
MERQCQGHHPIPIEYGGDKDQKLVSLCSACHLGIHYTAEALASKKGITKQYLTIEQTKRAIPLINTIIRAKLTCFKDPSNIRKITVEVPDYILVRLHKRKFDSGYHNLEKYILNLLVKDTKNL